MVASSIFKLAGRIASRMADRSVDSGLPRIEKLFGTPPRTPFPTTAEKIARSDEAFARGPYEFGGPPKEYTGPMEIKEVDEVIRDAPLNISEREYFRNLPRTGSGFFEKKLTTKDVEFFDDMMREGDPYDFMADIPSAKIRTDKKGNKYLRVQGEEDMNNLFKFIQDGPWEKGDLPPSLRRWDWDKSFKDIKEFKHGGGLSSINKPITINGQEHSLAWINPDEASALKAMGGSGKPGPMGIPSYQETDEYDYSVLDTSPAIDDFSSYQDDGGADIVGGTTVRGGQIGIDQGGTFTPVVGGFGEGDDPGEQGAKAFDQLVSRDQNLMERALGFFTGRPSDEKVTEKQSDLMNKAYQLGYGTWRNTAGRYSHDPSKDYDTWFAAQDPTALIAGYRVGDPVGKAMQQSFDIVSTQLQNKFKAARDDKAVGLDDDEEFEMTREELQNAAKDIKDIKDFTPYSGIDYPWYMPGGMLAKGLNFLSSNVVGTGTVGGVDVHVNKDGTVTPISPEDSPGFDHSGLEGENQAIERRKRKRVAPTSETVAEVEAGPMETFQAGLESIESNEGIENSIQILMNNLGVSESEARAMLGLDVNIA